MFDRYWNFTTCIRLDNLTTIADAMTHLLEQEEGCCRYERLRVENPNSELLFDLMNEVYKGYAERIDNALAEVIDKSKSCWHLRDLLYYVYAEPQQLEDKEAQLLYFQPPITYNPHPVILLPPEPLSEDDEDESF